MASEIFEHLYGLEELKRNDDYQDHGKLWSIDQRSFNTPEAKLTDKGFLYVPDACLNQSCKFHVDFHGCDESIVSYNDTFMR